MPSEMRSRSTSIASTTASTSLALLVVAHGFFAGLVPGEVGQVHQAVDAAGQADEHAEVGDRLDLARDLVALLVVRGELLPRVRLALLHAERDAAALLVDLEHHDFDFVAELHDLGRDATFLLVQSISETCTRPSMPCSISTNAP